MRARRNDPHDQNEYWRAQKEFENPEMPPSVVMGSRNENSDYLIFNPKSHILERVFRHMCLFVWFFSQLPLLVGWKDGSHH